MSKKNAKLKQEKSSKFVLWPIAFVISVAPLIVFMKETALSADVKQYWTGGYVLRFLWLLQKPMAYDWYCLALLFFGHFVIKKFEIKRVFFIFRLLYMLP